MSTTGTNVQAGTPKQCIAAGASGTSPLENVYDRLSVRQVACWLGSNDKFTTGLQANYHNTRGQMSNALPRKYRNTLSASKNKHRTSIRDDIIRAAGASVAGPWPDTERTKVPDLRH